MIRYLLPAFFREYLGSTCCPLDTMIGIEDIAFTREGSGRRNPTDTDSNQRLKVSYFWPTWKAPHGCTLPTLCSELPVKVMCQAQCARRWPREEEETSVLKHTVGTGVWVDEAGFSRGTEQTECICVIKLAVLRVAFMNRT